MNTLKTPDNEPIVSKLVSNTIETSQKNIEGKNFGIRKNVLQYDDVINIQRGVIYKQRNQVLDDESIKSVIERMIENFINNSVEFACPQHVKARDWNVDELYNKFKSWIPSEEEFKKNFNKEAARDFLLNKACENYNAKERILGVNADGVPEMRQIERTILLRNVDARWMDHIDAVDQLRRGIGLRAYGNRDPVVAYREITSDMFDAMNEEICENTAMQILAAQVRRPVAIKQTQTVYVSAANNKPDDLAKAQ
jgi:preprotein translocase subunit SecA